LIAELAALGIGECTQRGELPARRARWFHDNKAFSDWRDGQPFNVVRWERDQWRIRDRGLQPDFIVVPDIVAGGEASLAWSAMWRPFVAPGIPAYLVVQDGMTPQRVASWLDEQPDPYHGIFVGGTLEWKLDTGAAWVTFAHAHGMKCHIGRCGPPDRVRWAREIGADSIDSCLPLRDRGKLRAFVDALGLELADRRAA
jgi:hypothetical protein